MPLDPQALGHILEGVVERDPLTDRYRIMSRGQNGAEYQDVQDLLALFEGKEVRFTLASFEGLARLAQMVEDAGGGQVHGIMPEDLPTVPFNVIRRG